jgi:hypothetical protein
MKTTDEALNNEQKEKPKPRDGMPGDHSDSNDDPKPI